MPRNSSRTRRDERREAADYRALWSQVDCALCGRRHAVRRPCLAVLYPPGSTTDPQIIAAVDRLFAAASGRRR